MHYFCLVLYRVILPIFIVLMPAGAIRAQAADYMHNHSTPYDSLISAYRQLAESSKEAQLLEYGTTDAGKPLHLMVIDKDLKNGEALRDGKTVILINNGIHPGEPCGIDASLAVATQLLNGRENMRQLLERVIVCIIPVYNIGGCLNRSCCSRANQNGPDEYGFRGNARNLDLNRDFIKMDSRNSFAFAQIFHDWHPDVFIDTHTSDGADYSYTMTLIPTQSDKLDPGLAGFLNNKMLPELYRDMAVKHHEMCPYVHSINRIPDNGIAAFPDSPRYSTGYAALFNCIGFTSEAHMLKDFGDRVAATSALIWSVIRYCYANGNTIRTLKAGADQYTASMNKMPVQWHPDTTTWDTVLFKGYTARYQPSRVTTGKRLYYDRSAPYEKPIRYFNHYLATDTVLKPLAYMIPQAWHEVIERLKVNGVKMTRLDKDTGIVLNVRYIEPKEETPYLYEGHYPHSLPTARETRQKIGLHKGDYIIPTGTAKDRFIMTVLEPICTDSYFQWNFFDACLQQKEWFSPYVFEDVAARMLEEDAGLKEQFEAEKEQNPEMRKNRMQQLLWLYRHSPHFEKEYRRYPVYTTNEKFW